MSGFSPEWLALREPADSAARNRAVLAACARAFMGREAVHVCDIGAGTGASVRALAEHLPARQTWTLVDSDEENLAAAFEQLARWGESATADDNALLIRKGGRTLLVRRRTHDLAAAPDCWPEDTNLLTASALFDLTSVPWLERFVTLLSQRKIALLSMLTFDGLIALAPAHPLDRATIAAFNSHMLRDKGFGPAAGPHAAGVLEKALKNAGYEIDAGESPWVIDRKAEALLRATLEGIAAAARQTQALPAADIEHWLRSSTGSTQRLTVGHRDVFARPR